MARRLFGTDGVRGKAGEFLTAELALLLARTAVNLAGFERPQVLIVRDTRESGEMLEAAIAAGVTADPGGAAAAPPPRPADGGRHLGLAQPVRGQRHQAIRPRRLQAVGRERAAD